MYLSLNAGESWQRFQAGVPVTAIHDLILKDGDLVVATHGRSFWIVDDITPVHAAEAVPDNAMVHLFTPRTTIRFRTFHGFQSAAGARQELAPDRPHPRHLHLRT